MNDLEQRARDIFSKRLNVGYPEIIQVMTDFARQEINAALESKSEWISVKDQQPKENSDVLAYWISIKSWREDEIAIVHFVRLGIWHNPSDDEDDYRDPDYWMTLPKPPILLPSEK